MLKSIASKVSSIFRKEENRTVDTEEVAVARIEGDWSYDSTTPIEENTDNLTHEDFGLTENEFHNWRARDDYYLRAWRKFTTLMERSNAGLKVSAIRPRAFAPLESELPGYGGRTGTTWDFNGGRTRGIR